MGWFDPTPERWHDDEPDDQHDPPDLTVDIEDNPIIATLLGPDGQPLLEIHQRPVIAFGYTQ